MLRFDIEPSTVDDKIIIVRILGEMVISKELDVLTRKITREYGKKEDHVLILCLENMTYVNSMGVSRFLKLCKELKDDGVKIILTDMQESIRAVFANIGLLRILPNFKTLEHALQSLKKTGD
jgi:anti-anti-sigma factor